MRGILENLAFRQARDGTPYPQLILGVPKKVTLVLGFLFCATCHTRIQPDGSVIEGGQRTVLDLLLRFGGDVASVRRCATALFQAPWLGHAASWLSLRVNLLPLKLCDLNINHAWGPRMSEMRDPQHSGREILL